MDDKMGEGRMRGGEESLDTGGGALTSPIIHDRSLSAPLGDHLGWHTAPQKLGTWALPCPRTGKDPSTIAVDPRQEHHARRLPLSCDY